MATAHEIAVITNSCVRAPVDPNTGLLITQKDRGEVSLSSTWQGKVRECDFVQEHSPYSQTSKSVNFDMNNTSPDLSNLSDDDFYQRIVALKQEHKKTLQLCEELYTDKLSKLKHASPLSQTKSGMSTVSVSRDFSMSPQHFTSGNKSGTSVRRSLPASYKDNIQDMSASRPPTGRPKTADGHHNAWVNANGTPVSEKENELFHHASMRSNSKGYFSDQIHMNDSFDDSKLSAHSKISDMWENFSVDEYAPNTQPRPRSASLSRMTSSRSRVEKPQEKKKEWRHKITIPKPFNMTLRDSTTEPVKTRAMVELEEQREQKLRRDEAECEKKFKARSVPAHVYMPLYDEINEEKETRRRYIKENSEELLKSQVKPFKFTKREEEKKYQRKQVKSGSMADQDRQKKNGQFKANPYPAHIFDNSVPNKIKEEEEYRKIRVQMRSEELLKSASLPPTMAERGQDYVDGRSRHKLYAERAKKAGLTSDHKFKPHINKDMPDFDDLHRKYMREVSQSKSRREATVCKPFTMRSERVRREHQLKHEKERQAIENEEYGFRTRPQSAPRLTFTKTLSTSMDAIPARVTKATELRSSANREKLQRQIQSELSELESTRKKRLKEERLKKSITEKAMANDRTVIISKDRNAKLRDHRESDRAQQLEYNSQLNAMKERVDKRPLLFERTAQENAMKAANKRYQDTLHRAGIDEDFVNIKGKAASGSAEDFLSNGAVSEDEDSYMRSYSNKHSSKQTGRSYTEDYEKSDGDRTQSGGDIEDEDA